MSDRPNTTLIFGSTPARRIRAQSWGLWAVAAAIIVWDAQVDRRARKKREMAEKDDRDA